MVGAQRATSTVVASLGDVDLSMATLNEAYTDGAILP
jgi:hypothetical protein